MFCQARDVAEPKVKGNCIICIDYLIIPLCVQMIWPKMVIWFECKILKIYTINNNIDITDNCLPMCAHFRRTRKRKLKARWFIAVMAPNINIQAIAETVN